MSQVKLDQPVPNFIYTTNETTNANFNDLKGKNIILYFYPKDSTPGCTLESRDFRDHNNEFNAANTLILGISRDSLSSHEKFKNKHNIPFELISDEDESICKLFDVLKEKNMFGKKYMGIVRSTFLIDSEGILRKEWRKVKVLGHVKEVLQHAKEL